VKILQTEKDEKLYVTTFIQNDTLSIDELQALNKLRRIFSAAWTGSKNDMLTLAFDANNVYSVQHYAFTEKIFQNKEK
jgi:hypothetical protein